MTFARNSRQSFFLRSSFSSSVELWIVKSLKELFEFPDAIGVDSTDCATRRKTRDNRYQNGKTHAFAARTARKPLS
jgi:hypothetical protein